MGPWAVDLSHSDPSYLAGKGGAGEQAVPIAALNSQTEHGGAAFATDGTRYAFGFDVIAASDQAQNVNLDADALADYQDMVESGCAVLYVGTATFKGDATFKGCLTDATKSWPTWSTSSSVSNPRRPISTARIRTMTRPIRSRAKNISAASRS